VPVSTRFPQFVTPTNLKSVLDDTSILILLALAQMPVLLTRSIDLSVAANLALAGMCTALFDHAFPDAGMPTVIILAIAIGAALGGPALHNAGHLVRHGSLRIAERCHCLALAMFCTSLALPDIARSCECDSVAFRFSGLRCRC